MVFPGLFVIRTHTENRDEEELRRGHFLVSMQERELVDREPSIAFTCFCGSSTVGFVIDSYHGRSESKQ